MDNILSSSQSFTENLTTDKFNPSQNEMYMENSSETSSILLTPENNFTLNSSQPKFAVPYSSQTFKSFSPSQSKDYMENSSNASTKDYTIVVACCSILLASIIIAASFLIFIKRKRKRSRSIDRFEWNSIAFGVNGGKTVDSIKHKAIKLSSDMSRFSFSTKGRASFSSKGILSASIATKARRKERKRKGSKYNNESGNLDDYIKLYQNNEEYGIANDKYDRSRKPTFFEINVPPGKLGVKITTLNGSPLIQDIKPSSPLRSDLRVGDNLIAVNGIYVRFFNATKINEVISETRRQNETCKFFFVRP